MIDLFGKRKIKELLFDIEFKNSLIRSQETRIKNDMETMERLHKEIDTRKSFVYLLEENIPKEANARRAYMSDITMFYRKIFKDKLVEMISAQKDSLAILGKKETEYDIYRSNINCFFLLDEWFEKCEREHLSNLEEARLAAEDKVIAEEISKKYQ